MPHKESKLGSFGGKAEVASVDFIKAVLEQDRKAKKNNGVHLYEDNLQQVSRRTTASELLRQIDPDKLDPTQKLLAQALERQSILPITKAEQQIANAVTTHEAVRNYTKTSQYQKRIAVLQSMRGNDISYGETRSDFAGAVFADIANYMYKPSVQEGVLISSEVTDSLFLDLLRGEIPIEHEYGVRTLEEISIPDGMVIDIVDNKPQVTRFVEYSLTQKSDKYVTQFDAYKKRLGDFSLKSPESVSPHLQVDFVVPRPTLGMDYPKLESTESISAHYHFLPIEAPTFGHEIDDLLADQFKLTYFQKSRSKYS
jgi:hypothetical protein